MQGELHGRRGGANDEQLVSLFISAAVKDGTFGVNEGRYVSLKMLLD